MCQYLLQNDGRKSTALLTPLLQENRKIVLVAHFGFIDYVIYSRCLFLTYVPVVVTLFNGDKSPLLEAP